jgi:hypothetical protein
MRHFRSDRRQKQQNCANHLQIDYENAFIGQPKIATEMTAFQYAAKEMIHRIGETGR